MQKALDIRRKEQEDLLDLARQYMGQIQEILGPSVGVVFGSVARGDFHAASDIDILVISVNIPISPLERTSILYSVALPRVEPKGYTPEEFLVMMARGNPFATDVVENGMVIAGNRDWAALIASPLPAT